MAAGRYASFADLARSERAGRDYRIRWRARPGRILVAAPHGGDIEPGTSELAEAIAGECMGWYAFEGIKPAGNRRLHLSSTRFDEPRCLELLEGAPSVLTLHGCTGDGAAVLVGGRAVVLAGMIRTALESAGFRLEDRLRPHLQGVHGDNLCNRGRSGAGVQLELSRGLRRTFFASLQPDGRAAATPPLFRFCDAVRKALVRYRPT